MNGWCVYVGIVIDWQPVWDILYVLAPAQGQLWQQKKVNIMDWCESCCWTVAHMWWRYYTVSATRPKTLPGDTGSQTTDPAVHGRLLHQLLRTDIFELDTKGTSCGHTTLTHNHFLSWYGKSFGTQCCYGATSVMFHGLCKSNSQSLHWFCANTRTVLQLLEAPLCSPSNCLLVAALHQKQLPASAINNVSD